MPIFGPLLGVNAGVVTATGGKNVELEGEVAPIIWIVVIDVLFMTWTEIHKIPDLVTDNNKPKPLKRDE